MAVTHPDKVVFPGRDGTASRTKLELIRYYLAVADGALAGVAGRPMILKRFVDGIDAEAVFQKRAPANRPDWVSVAELRYASGRSAQEVVINDAAGLAWVINLGCVDLNPHPVRAGDLAHPMNFASISIRCPVSAGRRSSRWHCARGRCWPITG